MPILFCLPYWNLAQLLTTNLNQSEDKSKIGYSTLNPRFKMEQHCTKNSFQTLFIIEEDELTLRIYKKYNNAVRFLYRQ